MTSLISYISSDYQKAINSLKPKTSENSVLVYVEGNEDISFWRNILSPYEREISIKFEVKPYSKDSLATGKRNLEKIFSQTGKYLLIALDSDYDYLFPDHSDISQKINSNPYSGCAIHVGQQIPYLIALCPFSMYQTDAISAVYFPDILIFDRKSKMLCRESSWCLCRYNFR
jgi:hypothetical protein